MSTKQALKCLKEKLFELDPNAEEISFSNGMFEEIFYNLKGRVLFERELDIYQLIDDFFSDIPINKIEAISFQLADGKIYQEDKIMLMLNGGKKDCFLYPEANCFDPWIDYCLSTTVKTRQRIVKFYDMSKKSYEKLTLPPNTLAATKYGVGVGVHPDIVGIYILSEHYDEVVKFFNMPYPVPQELRERIVDKAPIHPFGITFNEVTGEILKLNYYFYHDYERDGASSYIKLINDAKQKTTN